MFCWFCDLLWGCKSKYQLHNTIVPSKWQPNNSQQRKNINEIPIQIFIKCWPLKLKSFYAACHTLPTIQWCTVAGGGRSGGGTPKGAIMPLLIEEGNFFSQCRWQISLNRNKALKDENWMEDRHIFAVVIVVWPEKRKHHLHFLHFSCNETFADNDDECKYIRTYVP